MDYTLIVMQLEKIRALLIAIMFVLGIFLLIGVVGFVLLAFRHITDEKQGQ